VGNISSAVVVALTGIFPAVITGTNPSELGNFPNYIFVYLHHLVIPECVIFVAIFVYFSPNQQLMDMYRRQFITMIDYIKIVYILEKNKIFLVICHPYFY
jgi:hypothetical protein